MPGISNVTHAAARLFLRTTARQVARRSLNQSLTQGRPCPPLLTESYSALAQQAARFATATPHARPHTGAHLLRIAAAAFGAAAVLGASGRRRVDAAPSTPEVLLEVAQDTVNKVQAEAATSSGPEATQHYCKAAGARVALESVQSTIQSGGGTEDMWIALEKQVEKAKQDLHEADQVLSTVQAKAASSRGSKKLKDAPSHIARATQTVRSAQSFLWGIEAVQAAMGNWRVELIKKAAEGVLQPPSKTTSSPKIPNQEAHAQLQGMQSGVKIVKQAARKGGGPGFILLALEKGTEEAMKDLMGAHRDLLQATQNLRAAKLGEAAELTLEDVLAQTEEESPEEQMAIVQEAKARATSCEGFWCGVEKVVQVVQSVIASFNTQGDGQPVEGAVGGDGVGSGEEPSTSRAMMPKQD